MLSTSMCMSMRSSSGPEMRFKYLRISPLEQRQVCVREPYQGQGYMRRIMDMAFQEGDRLGVPVLLETDAKSKCDKYVHLGMQLAGTRRFGEHGVLYDLIRYPVKSDD